VKLYTWKHAPNPRRVAIFLAEKGLEIPVEEVGEGAQLKPDFLAKSVHRRVPELELDDGTRIGEAMAICRYLEALHPNPRLFGDDPKHAALIEMWERWCEADGVFAVAEVFRNKLPAFAGRGLSGYTETTHQIPALVERGTLRVRAFFERLDRQLAGHKYVAGERFSVADITAVCATDFALRTKLQIPAECANVSRWHAELSARPSVAITR
jgi:glutathione S-transferase